MLKGREGGLVERCQIPRRLLLADTCDCYCRHLIVAHYLQWLCDVKCDVPQALVKTQNSSEGSLSALVSNIFTVMQHRRVGILIVATIYLQLIQNRYMFRSFTVLQCSHQHRVQPFASDVEVVGYL